MTDRRSKRFMLAITIIVCLCMYAAATSQRLAEEQAPKANLALEADREAQTKADALFIEAHYRARVGVKSESR